jgi:hypothetical protein
LLSRQDDIFKKKELPNMGLLQSIANSFGIKEKKPKLSQKLRGIAISVGQSAVDKAIEIAQDPEARKEAIKIAKAAELGWKEAKKENSSFIESFEKYYKTENRSSDLQEEFNK